MCVMETETVWMGQMSRAVVRVYIYIVNSGFPFDLPFKGVMHPSKVCLIHCGIIPLNYLLSYFANILYLLLQFTIVLAMSSSVPTDTSV